MHDTQIVHHDYKRVRVARDKMKEKISEVLNDETLETIESKVDKLAKELALLVVPKDKYNKLSERVNNLESEKAELQTKYDALEEQNLTTEELKIKELEKIEKQKKELSIEKNKIKAESMFNKAGIDEKQIETLLDKVVSDDETKTVELTNSFIEILSTKIEETKKQVTTDLLNGTKKPDVKTDEGIKSISLDDFKKMSYGEKKNLLLTDKEKYNELVEQEYKEL